jgi:homoserine O-acetyltransferase
MVSYPDFIDKAIPIVGSPRLAPFDLLLWQTENAAITSDPIWNNGDYTDQPALTLLTGLEGLAIETPDKFNQDTTREKLPEWFAATKKDVAEFDANNHIRQSEAMMAHDVSAPFDGSMERAAAAVKAKVLVIASRTDHMVTPGHALDFARLLQAEVLELQDNCGHDAPGCELAKISPAIAAFLAK